MSGRIPLIGVNLATQIETYNFRVVGAAHVFWKVFTMKLDLKTLGLSIALGLGSSVAMAGDAKVTVNVSMWDNGDTAMDTIMDGPNLGMALGGDMSLATMGITPDLTTVSGGDITFFVSNDSSWLIHEMVVAPVADLNAPLPYDDNEMEVDEDAAGAIGEVPETDPGQSGSVTLHLDPGTYVLFCNIPGHYAMGMWATITVTE